MPDLIRRESLKRAARKRGKRRQRPATLPPVGHLHGVAVSPALVSLAWTVPRHEHRHLIYEVLRDGRVIAQSHQPRFADHTVKPLRRYRYAIRPRLGRQTGKRSPTITVLTPALPPPKSGPPQATPQPVQPPLPTAMTRPMVDRLFWRAGFGPSDADRQQWTGQPVAALVDHFLTTPYALNPTTTPATNKGYPIDPLASDQELQMEWLDRMQRTTNPLVERMNFFWHRHWAVSKDAGIPSAILLAYRDRLRSYSDFAANPTASFHDLAVEMTTQDAAMSMYLTGYLNQKNRPNENYGREFMELFTLGATDAQGKSNYTQTDVHELARAFTGYTLNQSAGTVTFNPNLFDGGSKTILAQSGNFDAPGAVGVVLAHRNHAPFLVSKLWSEFIRTPIPGDALAGLTQAYIASGLQLSPVLRGILNHPLIFESLTEPNLIKSPVVYTVGVLRTLNAPLADTWQTAALGHMQQQPYHPPNVAGWEGGLSWMNTATSVARFDLVVRCQGLLGAVADVPGETGSAAFSRAFGIAGSPWLAQPTVQALLSYAGSAPVSTPAQRRERIYALVAMMLGGPDGQVM